MNAFVFILGLVERSIIIVRAFFLILSRRLQRLLFVLDSANSEVRDPIKK